MAHYLLAIHLLLLSIYLLNYNKDNTAFALHSVNSKMGGWGVSIEDETN